MRTYNNPRGIRAAIAAVLQIPIDEVELAYTGDGFTILRPADATPDPDEVAAWEPPVIEPEPVDPLTAAILTLGGREQVAASTITRLKATAAVALVMGGMSEADAYAAGTALVVQHASLIQAYILAGGNALAGQAFIDAIVADSPAWWGPAYLAMWQDALL